MRSPIQLVDVDRPETWTRYRSGLCNGCAANCCTMPVEVRLPDLVRLQLVERDMSNSTKGSHSRESGAYWDRRLTEAQRRYLRAVNLLAKVRHIGPAVQVNVANQQVVQNR